MVGMSERRANWLAAIMAAALLVAFSGSYVTAYFVFGELDYLPPDGQAARLYPTPRMARLFRPGAKIESAIRGKKVVAGWQQTLKQ